MALTAKRVAKLLRKGEPGRHLDARGLYLVINSPTNAYWERRYMLDGREHRHGLGSARVFSLVEARERNRRVSQLLADGRDPLVAKREAKAARIAEAAKAITFGEAAADYYRNHAPTWKHLKHAAQWRSSVLGLTLSGKPAEGDYCRALRSLPVATIDTPIILSMLKPHWLDKVETMARVRARIEAVLDAAKAAGYRQGDNPASWSVIGEVLPSRDKVAKVNHHAAVPYAELPAFVAELRKREGTAARALEFLVYVAGRSTEVREATWGEINLDGAVWEIPAERMKAEQPHKVPLAPEALELLRGLYREDDGDDGFLFIGPQPGKPLSEAALRALMRRMGRTEVPHGFRSAFSDWSHEQTGFSNHAIEISLSHAVGSEVERSYRRGSMFEKRRQLMAAWARYVTSPPVVQEAKGDDVVSMGRGRS
jgi:integrase